MKNGEWEKLKRQMMENKKKEKKEWKDMNKKNDKKEA